jgi:hypothetical protein
MKLLRVVVGLLFLMICGSALAFDIYALGTSATNCKGVERDKIFPVRLEQFLRGDGYDATVINGGEDGDKPVWMIRRLDRVLGSNVRLVIFEPGPNDRDGSSALEATEKILGILREHHMPAIYASNYFQTPEEAADTAKKYDAYYYGPWSKGIPVDSEHWQFDFNMGGKGPGGHMTAAGCELVARQMVPLVEKVLLEKGIR